MRPSVRSGTPHLIDIGRADSDTSIQIDKDISVVSSQRDGLKLANRRGPFSTKHLLLNGPIRRSSQGATSKTSKPQLNRWHSEPKLSNMPSAPSRQRPQPYHQLQTTAEAELLKSNRESMIALADFLRTKVLPKPVLFIPSSIDLE